MKKIMFVVLAVFIMACEKDEVITNSENCASGISSVDASLQGDWNITGMGLVTFENGTAGAYTYEVTDCGQSVTISDGTKITFLNPTTRQSVSVLVVQNGSETYGTMER